LDFSIVSFSIFSIVFSVSSEYFNSVYWSVVKQLESQPSRNRFECFPMKANDPWLIGFYTVASFSVLCTLSTLFHLTFYGNFGEFRISLLFLLHLTLLLQCIAYLPLAYTDCEGLCAFMGFVHHYCGFAHVLVVFLMGWHHYSYINTEKYAARINSFIASYGLLIIFLVPTVTALPFITNSYGVSQEIWCDLPPDNRTANDWALIVYFAPVFSFDFVTFIQFAYSMVRLHYYQTELNNNLFLSTGIYIFISLLAEIPRIILRMIYFSDPNQPGSNVIAVRTILPLYLTGILYFIVYLIGLHRLSHPRIQSGYNDYNLFFSMSFSSFQQLLEDIRVAGRTLSKASSSSSSSVSTTNRSSAASSLFKQHQRHSNLGLGSNQTTKNNSRQNSRNSFNNNNNNNNNNININNISDKNNNRTSSIGIGINSGPNPNPNPKNNNHNNHNNDDENSSSSSVAAISMTTNPMTRASISRVNESAV
jgi:hypothetical protein